MPRAAAAGAAVAEAAAQVTAARMVIADGAGAHRNELSARPPAALTTREKHPRKRPALVTQPAAGGRSLRTAPITALLWKLALLLGRRPAPQLRHAGRPAQRPPGAQAGRGLQAPTWALAAKQPAERRRAAKPRFGALRLLAGLTLAAVSSAAPAAAAAICPAPGGRSIPARVIDIGADGSLTLEDGRRLVLASISPPTRLDPAPELAQAAAAAASQVARGRDIRLFEAGIDRHGRILGRAQIGEADLALMLVEAGAAYAIAGAACAEALLAAEESARQARRGLWARPEARLDTADEATLSRYVGLYAVAEGRILSLGIRRDRTYLNFGETWRRDFTVIVPTADFATILGHGRDHGRDSGRDPGRLRGTVVRVRGVVRDQGGPAIVNPAKGSVERGVERIEDPIEKRGRR